MHDLILLWAKDGLGSPHRCYGVDIGIEGIAAGFASGAVFVEHALEIYGLCIRLHPLALYRLSCDMPAPAQKAPPAPFKMATENWSSRSNR